VKQTIEEQYETSVHGTGELHLAEGGEGSCARCHSNEGFILTQRAGTDTVAEESILQPTRIQCMTCHDFHETLDQEGEGPDYALRTKKPVDLLMYRTIDSLVTIDFANEGNLCANCHQPRRPAPDIALAATDSLTIDSRYGPHYGIPAVALEGIGGYEIAGTDAYPTTPFAHREDASCVKCHMNNFNHSFDPSLDACNTCHNSITDFDVNGTQTTISNLLANLQSELVAVNMLDGTDRPVAGKYPVNRVGALYNYRFVKYDKSMGVHNPPYIEALLRNSIEVFN
jgi:hypothetical protein